MNAPPPDDKSSAQRRASFAVAVWTALSLTAVVLVSRRLAGAFSQFPHGAVTVLIAGLGFAAAWVSSVSMAGSRRREARLFRDAPQQQDPSKRSPASNAVQRAGLLEAYAVTLLPPLLIGLALTPSGATATQMALVTLAVFAAIATAVFRTEVGGQDVESPIHHSPLTTHASPTADAGSVGHAGVGHGDVDGELHGSHWMQRATSDDGLRETAEGIVTVSFAAGQKFAVAHVAFCPLLPGVPEVDCEPADGADVRWKIAARQPYGLRIEVRRSNASEPAEVPMAWFASANVRRATAA